MQQLVNEIKRIKYKLEKSHSEDTILYIPPQLRELRNYIFQVHSDYELSLEIIIKGNYLNDKPFELFHELFAQITFAGKLKITRQFASDFPRKAAEEVNNLRNDFAHKKGSELYCEHMDESELLDIYKKLEKAHDKLNTYWEQS